MLKLRLPNSPQNLTIATTGASGSIFLRHLLLAVDRDTRIQNANFIASDSALRVMAEELGLRGRNNLITQVLGHTSRKIHQQANADIGANVASGSYPADAMIVLPCSVGTLARIANGIASQLIERAADAGATIFPLIPAYYFRPASLDQMAHEFACRVLAHIGLPQKDAYRWKG
jgi:4-hydroxy-3-polyprenylbenzoate decarboxylase